MNTKTIILLFLLLAWISSGSRVPCKLIKSRCEPVQQVKPAPPNLVSDAGPISSQSYFF